jgi:U3 small nucleolar RNA-associated protein 25
VASPLALRVTEETHFLSSIEILIIDRASVIYMQNWEHLEYTLRLVNQLPEHKHITSELLNIRPYYFEGLAKFYR